MLSRVVSLDSCCLRWFRMREVSSWMRSGRCFRNCSSAWSRLSQPRRMISRVCCPTRRRPLRTDCKRSACPEDRMPAWSSAPSSHWQKKTYNCRPSISYVYLRKGSFKPLASTWISSRARHLAEAGGRQADFRAMDARINHGLDRARLPPEEMNAPFRAVLHRATWRSLPSHISAA